MIAGLVLLAVGGYLAGWVATSIYVWRSLGIEKGDDPLDAGVGLLLAVIVGSIWPMLVVVSPFMLLLWLVGKVITR